MNRPSLSLLNFLVLVSVSQNSHRTRQRESVKSAAPSALNIDSRDLN
jgi:hypothetical protein